MIRQFPAVVLATLVVGCPAGAHGETGLERLFPLEADVTVSGSGFFRLVLPGEVLRVCRPDLSDLRIVDRQGREVPFVIDSGPPARQTLHLTRRVEAKVLDVAREQSGQDPAVYREQYTLAFPGPGPRGGSWVLVVSTAMPEFVRTVTVEGVLPTGGIVPLVADKRLFRLPRSHAATTRVELPPFDGHRVRVTIAGEGAGFLDPAFRFESRRPRKPRGTLSFDLPVVSHLSSAGASIYELARPRGVVPHTLRVATSTATLDRAVTVFDVRPGEPDVEVGRARLLRLRAPERVERMEVSLLPVRGERLRVEIEDRDSPPLRDPSFQALVPRPALIFFVQRPRGGGPAAVLRFGGGRAYRPRYDLADLFSDLAHEAAGERARVAASLYDPDAFATAELGPIRPNPRFDRRPALAFAMRAGAHLDSGSWALRKRLRIPRSPEGLVRLPLGADDVAHLRPDLADVRVVDAEGRQWPYLPAAEARPQWIALGPPEPGAERESATSHYRFTLPAAGIPADTLELLVEADFFDRPFRILATVDGHPRQLTAGRMRRPALRRLPVRLSFPRTRIEALELVVEDGDDAPLHIGGARLRALLPDLYLVAPEGSYFLLLGNPAATAPRYDLARARELVLAANAVEVVAVGPIEPNPAHRLPDRLRTPTARDTARRLLLWSSLLVAVLVLGVLTLRVVRSSTGGPGRGE